jgi:hypothetical protein
MSHVHWKFQVPLLQVKLRLEAVPDPSLGLGVARTDSDSPGPPAVTGRRAARMTIWKVGSGHITCYTACQEHLIYYTTTLMNDT